jgi:hypothetical protein
MIRQNAFKIEILQHSIWFSFSQWRIRQSTFTRCFSGIERAVVSFAYFRLKIAFVMGMTANFIRVTPSELESYLADSRLLADRIYAVVENDSTRYDIDKSWDGILFLLTGKNSSDTSAPLSRLIFSNQLIDKQQDLGTGPAHYLTPQEVSDLNEQIKMVIPSSLKQNFNATAMKELGVYPNNVWDEEEVDEYLIEYFETVQEIFAVASGNGEAIITFIQ